MAVSAQYQITGASANAIAGSVEAGVEAGALPPGAALPSVRALAAALGVSPATVAAAYRDLRARGTVVSAERRGVRVAARSPLPARAAPPLPPGIRDLASGNPDPALLPALPWPAAAGLPAARGGSRAPGADADADAAIVAAHPAPRLYAEAVDLPALLEQARDRFRADGIPAAALAVTSGALDGIERVLGAHLRPGDRVAVEDPGYSGVLDLARALGLEPVGVGLDARGPLPDRLAAALGAGARAAILTPRAQNPTGATLDDARAADLAEVLAGHPGALLIEDDHAGPVAGTPHRTLTAGRERWAVLRSVSKSLGPDLRLAVLAGDAVTVARVQGRQRLGPGWVSHVLQRLVAALWADPATSALLERAAAAYGQRRAALVTALVERGVAASAPSGLNVWVPVPAEGPVLRGLQQAGWAVQPGEVYRVATPPAVRITITTLQPAEAPALADALAGLLRPATSTNPA